MQTQTYATHRYRPAFWLLTVMCGTTGLVLITLLTLRQPTGANLGMLLVAFAAVCTVYMLRQYALRLQDRIIRLEMQTRVARLGRAADLSRLTMRQIIAVRFASDAELPILIDRALAENLTPDQIKRAVGDWQADHLRT